MVGVSVTYGVDMGPLLCPPTPTPTGLTLNLDQLVIGPHDDGDDRGPWQWACDVRGLSVTAHTPPGTLNNTTTHHTIQYNSIHPPFTGAQQGGLCVLCR